VIADLMASLVKLENREDKAHKDLKDNAAQLVNEERGDKLDLLDH